MSGGGGGGKGGESETKINPEIAEAARQNYAMAQATAQLGHQPNRGVTVAALDPTQIASMENNNTGLDAFGMSTSAPMAGLPQPETDSAGFRGYSTAPSYDDMMSRMPSGYREYIDQFFINPETGVPPTWGSQPAAAGAPAGGPNQRGGGGYGFEQGQDSFGGYQSGGGLGGLGQGIGDAVGDAFGGFGEATGLW